VTLGSNVKIKDCVILQNVVIHDDVMLTGCFVNYRAVIGSGMTLKDQEVGYQEQLTKQSEEHEEPEQETKRARRPSIYE
jgi:ADP-glucose pyrophosphorylase